MRVDGSPGSEVPQGLISFVHLRALLIALLCILYSLCYFFVFLLVLSFLACMLGGLATYHASFPDASCMPPLLV